MGFHAAAAFFGVGELQSQTFVEQIYAVLANHRAQPIRFRRKRLYRDSKMFLAALDEFVRCTGQSPGIEGANLYLSTQRMHQVQNHDPFEAKGSTDD